MIYTILRGIRAESLKTKRTFTAWFTLIGALLIPFVYFLIFFFRSEYFLPKGDENPWVRLITSNFQAIGFFMFSLYVIITIAINFNIEHKINSWKKLFVLPVRRETLYFSKLIFLLLQVMTSLLIFMSAITLSGVVLGFLNEDFLFFESSFPFPYLVLNSIKIFIAILAVFSIQFLLGIIFKNAIIPISIGVFLTIVALTISSGWEYSIYYPYSFTAHFALDLVGIHSAPTVTFWNESEILSVVLFLVVNATGILYFNRKEIK